MSGSEKIFCCFTLEQKQYLGELVLSGEDSSLMLHSRHQIPYTSEPHPLFGETVNYQKISLFECVGDPSFPEGTHPKFVYKRTCFPHYAAIGSRHIQEHEPLFGSVSFSTDDLGLIFANRGTFGSAHPTPEDLQNLLDKTFDARVVTVSHNPLIFYFSGSKDDINVDVSEGKFSTFQGFGTKISDHEGIQCTPESTATFKFGSIKTLSEVIDELVALLLFLSVVAGRQQSITKITAEIFDPKLETSSEAHEKADIYWSLAPTIGKNGASNIRDMPVTPQIDSHEFYQIFNCWMQRHKEWLPSRLRILNSQNVGRHYDENRLVAAANAFDILPDSTYPETGELSPSAKEARLKCKAIMKELDSGPEREQIMNTLAFWGGKNLRLKVLSRSRIVREALGDTLEDLDAVLIIAVLARNYFVHGSNKFGWENYSDLISFFTDALEFVFVASDLIECGWKAANWSDRCRGYSHPLAAFMRSYDSDLAKFRLADAAAKGAQGTS
ncbi:hypothetical protein NJH24_14045 [Pseudomonas asiatica]|uniref:ApeA N-terminal domain 1-containing protein n=1 Tax=Pseudomonas asiatica TaxID=2219225 RepID=UPI00209A845A|nr:HEPN domain-containing protein [Pseudomonas asiatica]MCO7535895.1 hypothetical protein [Pseudomonas asiatica]MCO7549659.1 hypothetical protein [Pseudomonas asiatica]MCO7560208.1 hypothetical protein [Pseudomonas asiatica]